MKKADTKKNYEILDWDSERFGYKVAKITTEDVDNKSFRNLLKDLSSKGIRLVYFFVPPKNKSLNRVAVRNKGFLVDEKVTYLKELPKKSRKKKHVGIKSYLKRKLVPRLRFLSLEAGVYSRYRVDPHCEKGEFEKLYTEWIKNSLSGKIARDVLVYLNKGKEIGFITMGEKNGRCNIGLIAVDPAFRSEGVGGKLLDAAFDKAVRWGYREMDVVTQMGNIGACRFYEKNGFKLESVVNIYHFWL